MKDKMNNALQLLQKLFRPDNHVDVGTGYVN